MSGLWIFLGKSIAILLLVIWTVVVGSLIIDSFGEGIVAVTFGSVLIIVTMAMAGYFVIKVLES